VLPQRSRCFLHHPQSVFSQFGRPSLAPIQNRQNPVISQCLLFLFVGNFGIASWMSEVQLYAFFILVPDGVGVHSQGFCLITTHVTHCLVDVLSVVMQTCCESLMDLSQRLTDPLLDLPTRSQLQTTWRVKLEYSLTRRGVQWLYLLIRKAIKLVSD
jgi:hypothetical protein